MDHTYCVVTVAKAFPKRRNTYASRIEKLRAANSKDQSVTESLMVEAGAWLKVVIKDEDEEEEICHAVASEGEEEEGGEEEEEERPDRCSPTRAQTPSGLVSQSDESAGSYRAQPHTEKPAATEEEEEEEEERGSSQVNRGEEEEEESDEAYLERAVAVARIRELQMRLRKARSFSVEKLRDSAADIQRHTGLPDYRTFLTLYRFLRPKGSGQMQYWGSVFKGRQRSGGNELGRHRKLSPMDELLLTLIRLWRGSPRKELAARFGVSESVVTRVFITWCNVMYEHFQQLPIVWSSETEEQEEEEGRSTQDARGRRQHAVKTVPAAVKEAYLQAAAYLTQSALPLGSKTRAFGKPLSRDGLVEFLERYSTADGGRDEEMEEELGRPEQPFSESEES